MPRKWKPKTLMGDRFRLSPNLVEEQHTSKLIVFYRLLFILSLVVPLSKGEYNTTICYKGTNNTDHRAQFQESLNSVFSILNSASSTTHFYNATAGSTPEEQVFALFLCRYDISLPACHNCITGATTDQLNFCPGFRQALSFYRECTLHYANRPIVSRLRISHKKFWCDYPRLRDPLLNKTIKGTVLGLIDNATSAANSRYYYAKGEETYMVYQKLYYQVLCSPDIIPSYCKKCLTDALYDALYQCDVSIGVTFSFGSCSVMYSFYPFFHNTTNTYGLAPQPHPSSPPLSTGDPPNSSPTFAPDTLSIALIWIVSLFMEMGQHRT